MIQIMAIKLTAACVMADAKKACLKDIERHVRYAAENTKNDQTVPKNQSNPPSACISPHSTAALTAAKVRPFPSDMKTESVQLRNKVSTTGAKTTVPNNPLNVGSGPCGKNVSTFTPNRLSRKHTPPRCQNSCRVI